ncbi:glycoside hydrolase family 99-like domain-containing protein [Brucella sp. JSBI001]|nr:glycoside hydrolase family 99-like domain-containing protein [Brucella sp. JSBI001]UZD70429.1 glycoside hydrolase family 99-like domain-containing protein [Brucella sp. JSBI001]
MVGAGLYRMEKCHQSSPKLSWSLSTALSTGFGFYDLRIPDTFEEQVKLAKENSIFGFCFYYYWFSGRRILEKPIDLFLESKIDFPFCFCWANENWTKRWDGGNNEVVLENEHSVENDNRFIEDVFPYMRDQRYITYEGVPVLLVYRPDILTDAKQTFSHWRQRAIQEGFPGLFIVAVAYHIFHPDECGADALAEFPPHQYVKSSTFARHPPHITNPQFNGLIMDYRTVMAESITRKHDDFVFFTGRCLLGIIPLDAKMTLQFFLILPQRCLSIGCVGRALRQ